MQTVNEASGLLKRQAELENAMRQPGGIRITGEHVSGGSKTGEIGRLKNRGVN